MLRHSEVSDMRSMLDRARFNALPKPVNPTGAHRDKTRITVDMTKSGHSVMCNCMWCAVKVLAHGTTPRVRGLGLGEVS